jgi:hypothetical protein
MLGVKHRTGVGCGYVVVSAAMNQLSLLLRKSVTRTSECSSVERFMLSQAQLDLVLANRIA